jgi:hypothetical protein
MGAHTCHSGNFEVKVLLDSFGLLDKFITYVKDRGSNLSTLTSTLTSVVTYSPLQLTNPFMGSCFGHAMSNSYQYASNDSKVCAGFTKVSLKSVQTLL